MDLNQQKGTLRAYYASVSYVDALVGKILTALEATGQRDNTIVIFTESDHGYHLGEHDLWQKVSIHEESAKSTSDHKSPWQKTGRLSFPVRIDRPLIPRSPGCVA